MLQFLCFPPHVFFKDCLFCLSWIKVNNNKNCNFWRKKSVIQILTLFVYLIVIPALLVLRRSETILEKVISPGLFGVRVIPKSGLVATTTNFSS